MKNHKIAASAMAVAILVGCGASGSSDSSAPAKNGSPQAVAEETTSTSEATTTTEVRTTTTLSLREKMGEWGQRNGHLLTEMTGYLDDVQTAGYSTDLAGMTVACRGLDRWADDADAAETMPDESQQEHWDNVVTLVHSYSQLCIEGVAGMDIEKIQSASAMMTQITSELQVMNELMQAG